MGEAEVLIPIVGMMIPIVAIVMSGIERTSKHKHREESRREIAAYVAEGTITPDDAIRMMAAGEKTDKPGKAEKA